MSDRPLCDLCQKGAGEYRCQACTKLDLERRLRESTDYAEECRAVVELVWQFGDMMNDGPDDSDVALANSWLVQAFTKAREIRRAHPINEGAGAPCGDSAALTGHADQPVPQDNAIPAPPTTPDTRQHTAPAPSPHLENAVVPKYDAFQWTGDLIAFERWFGERLAVDFGGQISVPVHKSEEGKWFGPWLRVWCGSWVIRHEGRNHTVTDAVYKLLTQTIPSQGIVQSEGPEA